MVKSSSSTEEEESMTSSDCGGARYLAMTTKLPLPSANTSLLDDDQPATEYQLYAEENGGGEVEDIILQNSCGS